MEEVKEKIITKMTKHDELLKSISMVTNVSKTELIYFARKPIAAQSLKSKMCAGIDGIPLKIIKDLGVNFPWIFLNLFNRVATDGMPDDWKMAVVTPLHKNGSKTKITQYRPISNLSSCSKLFEKVILSRINSLGELDGRFQHGFKSNRSTVSAMLEVQDFVAGELDANKIVGLYSLDLSAAFDVLRPDVFYRNLESKIDPQLLSILMDFLTDRKFKVKVENSHSLEKDLKIGCVQGSILGPRLFTLYLSDLASKLSEAFVVSYADDTYVAISDPDVNVLKLKLEDTMTRHDDFLCSIGMVTNVDKTELTYFSRGKIHGPPLMVKNQLINASPVIKILGIKFESNLEWDVQVQASIKKSRIILKKLRFISRFIDKKHMMKVITAHLFSMLYYAAPVWLNPLTRKRHITMLNSIHYRAMRLSIGDWRNKIPRREVDLKCKRATPTQWMAYCNAKVAIELTNLNKDGPRLSEKMHARCYVNERRPGLGTFMDESRLRIGRNSLPNRLEVMKSINFDWFGDINKHSLRINLKKTIIK